MLRRQNGDTLIEVALSMAILGAVIAIAYGLSNRAVRLGREAKERNEAAQLQQYQAEALRNYRDNHGYEAFKNLWNTRFVTQATLDTDDEPCAGPGISANNRMNFSVVPSGTAFKWSPNADAVKHYNLYTQCVTAIAEDPAPLTGQPRRIKLDIFISWPAIGDLPDNSSVLTVHLTDIASIPSGATP